MTEFPTLAICALFVAIVNCEYISNVIDVDDILAEDYMPGTLLVLENPTKGITNFNGTLKKAEEARKVTDGSFVNAMETMTFHRSMMNEYLCRNFVAEEIIKDMTTSRVNRRMGHITPGSEPSKFKPGGQNNLLNDEGSLNYKNWLSKSTTLEDIYRHYDQAQNRIDGDIIEDEDKGEDFDEEYNGHVTGHVYPQPHEGHSPTKHRGHTGLGMYYAGGGGYPYPNAVYHHHAGGSTYQHGGSSGSGYHYGDGHHNGGDVGYHQSAGGGGYSHEGGYGEGDYSHHDGSGGGHSYSGGHAVVETIYHSSPPKYQGQHETSYGGKDHDLSDLFDIALTALAFLSFGLFIIHVIMCISAANNSTTTTAASMMPMSMSPTATATGTGNGGGGSMAPTGGSGTGGGTPSTGTGSGSTSTGSEGGMADTGGGATGMGGGDMGTGDGNPGGTEGDNTGTGGGGAGTGGGDIDGGGDGTGTTGAGGDNNGTGGGGADTGSGTTGGGTTGSASPGTGTGTGDGTDNGSTGTGGGAASTGTGSTGTGSGRDTFKFRLRRDIPTITNPNNQALNELARRVLTSIEASLIANADGGICLRKSLCENNKYSRNLEGKDKIIIPIWSLGMSWLAGRLVKTVAPATSMLDTLKASILGLGKANCDIIYQDCDLKRERRKRRRKRRKRSAINT